MNMSKDNRDRIIASLYERCQNGEISVNQRELLIKKLNSSFTPTETQFTESKHESLAIKRDKFNAISDRLYQDCARGIITLEQREILLERAREEYLTSDDIITESAIGDLIDKIINEIMIKLDIAKFKKKCNELDKIEKDYHNKTGGYLTFSGPYSMDDLIKNLQKYYNIMNTDLKEYKKYSDDYSVWSEKFDKSYNNYITDRYKILNGRKNSGKRYEYQIQDFLNGYLVVKKIQRIVLDGLRKCKNWKCDDKDNNPKFNNALQHYLILHKKMFFIFSSDYENAFNNVYRMCKDKDRVEGMKTKYGTEE